MRHNAHYLKAFIDGNDVEEVAGGILGNYWLCEECVEEFVE